MSEAEINVEVWGDLIIVTEPNSNHFAIYHKPSNEPQLIAKGMPNGTVEFKVKA
jgi:hypothetical protein